MTEVYPPLAYFVPQNIQHLLQLKVCFGFQLNLIVLQNTASLNTFKIKTSPQLAIGLIQSVGYFMLVQLTNDIKRRHTMLPDYLPNSSKSVPLNSQGTLH